MKKEKLYTIREAEKLTGLKRGNIHMILIRYPEIKREPIANPVSGTGNITMLPESSLQYLTNKVLRDKIKNNRS